MATAAPELDLDASDKFQRMEWRVQRFGWIIWAIVLLAALAGLLGPGYFSNATASPEDNSFLVNYERFLRYHHPTRIEVTLQSDDAQNDEVGVHLDRGLLDRIEVRRIEPEPERREITDNGVAYWFLNRTSSPGGKIVFHVEFERMGTGQGAIGLVGGESASLDQFVYP